jgi:hypothetical protein
MDKKCVICEKELPLLKHSRMTTRFLCSKRCVQIYRNSHDAREFNKMPLGIQTKILKHKSEVPC